MANFLIGEGKLESYFEEHPPIEANFAEARIGLADAKTYLSLVTGDDGKRAGIALDAHLLLAKLLYACGDYEESLENFSKAELNSLSEKELTLYVILLILLLCVLRLNHLFPVFIFRRSLKILAESYAIKGLCLENISSKSGSKFKQAERETEMVCMQRFSFQFVQTIHSILTQIPSSTR